MAITFMKLSVETDLIADAARDLLAANEAVRHHHGEAFRALENRLQALADSSEKPDLHLIEGGVFIVTPPQEWLDILNEARRLGLI